DLVDNPELTLSRIFSFLNLEADPSQLVKTIPVYRTKRETWRSNFSAEDRLVFHREAGDLLIELGYEDDESWVRSRPDG
ncbi:MAG TPA: hypothetical protein VE131_15010, partial [Terriglobales bacterium]|nr:hypothetical protein [Terriglobales bacterium]